MLEEERLSDALRTLTEAFQKNKLTNELLDRVRSGALWTDVKCERKSVGRQEVVDVLLTQDLQILAACLAVYLRQRARAEGLTEIRKGDIRGEIIGMEGNFATAAFIYENFLEALGHVAFGKSDRADLEIGNYKVDVKTGTKAAHKKLMISKAQWYNPKRHFNFYVGCTEISESVMRIWGYATYEDVERFIEELDWSGSRLEIPLERLRPITELKELTKQSKQGVSNG